ncbi:O-antigen ligase family protein [Methylophaga pinxianii]|uniref:O-antigen ligase family protein n=1 Tax=Methylophaga pinxianii TaxID=2881052 RepID=UPI001CF3DBAC|nr:Wzy polymerase domain-containing protein [Methylophaga pinxianii]MCB2427909.1 Wzy polymerase domain-containing protein [Methylophaga pinxianii]UPH44400.1 Wzy polymerase domain-containing protein [Methylophaga pinxianii]
MSRTLSKYPLLPQQPIEWLLALLFLISPFYLASSLGGTGFDLPFNITVWAAATVVIAYSAWYFCGQDKLILPPNYKGLLALPVGILLAAALAGVHDPITWLFRIVYVMAGVIFLFGLFQFRLKNTDRILLLLSVATLLHGLFGLVQLFQPLILDWIPKTNTQIATGVFQQVNVMASFLVTGILICIYLCLRPISYKRPNLKVFLLLTITVATYVMVSTGSRIGLLSGIFGLLMLLIGYRNQVRKNWKTIISVLILILVASWLAKEGIHKTLDKTYKIVEAQYSDQRLSIYRISFDAFSEAPIRGHGIGSFLEQFGLSSSEFYKQHPTAEMPNYIAHPHNELLQWAIEGGLLALGGIVIAVISVLWFVIKQRQQRLLAYLALLLPITFHTQVEHPFYISSLHWFIWLTLLFVLLNHQLVVRQNSISLMAKKSLRGLLVILLIVTLLFLWQTSQAQQQLYQFIKQSQQAPQLDSALNNLYYKTYAEQIVMRTHLHDAIGRNDADKLVQVVNWFESELVKKPELKVFEDIINGYFALEQTEKRCQTIGKSLQYYPANKVLQNLQQDCSAIN